MSYGMDYAGNSGGGFGGGGGGFGGGGFGGGSQSSPSGGGGGSARRSRDEQTVQPVTINMILSAKPDPSSPDGTGLMLDDERKLYHVKMVGAVRSVDDLSTNVLYKIEDGTGLMEVKQWQDQNECSAMSQLRETTKQENIYVKIVGQIKDYQGNKMVVADSIRPLSTGNELAHHMLEVVYAAEESKRKNTYVQPQQQQQQQMPQQQGIGFGAAAPAMGGGAPLSATGHQMGGGNSVIEAVSHFFRVEGEKNEAGANIHDCVAQLRNKFSEQEIRSAIDALSMEGTIYSTIDEENYKSAM